MKNPKDLAIYFIKPYILRGDSIDSLIKGQGGYSCKEEAVQMGGYVFDGSGGVVHRGKPHEIIVYRLQGQPCLYIYNIYKLAEEMGLEGQGIKQMDLGFI